MNIYLKYQLIRDHYVMWCGNKKNLEGHY